MKKIMQLVLIVALVGATNSYGWDWPWKNWFKTRVSPEYVQLDTETKHWFGEPSSFVQIPKDLEKDKSYKIISVGIGRNKEYFMKPSSKSYEEIRLEQQGGSIARQGVSPMKRLSLEDIRPGQRTYFTRFSTQKPWDLDSKGGWTDERRYFKRVPRAFTPKAEAAFKRAQSGE
jgi:hypothetical protein